MLHVEKKGRAQIRSKNKVRVFKTLVELGAMSRTQLEKHLKLSAPSVTRIVEELLKDGLVCETTSEQTTVGRRPVLLETNADCFYVCGVSIKKSELSLCVLNMQMKVLYQAALDLTAVHTSQALEHIFAKAIVGAREAVGASAEQWLGVGVAARGIVDRKNGVILRFREGVENVSLSEIIERELDCFWYIENNIVADIEHEYIDSAEAPEDSLLYLFVDEGVGCSVINRGEIVSGAHFMSGKIAHMVVEPGGRLCSCGKQGHLESYVTARAIEKEYAALCGAQNSSVSAIDVCKRACLNEPKATMVVQDALQKLSQVLLTLVTVLNPGTIVLYAPMFEEYPAAYQYMQRVIEENVFQPAMAQIQWKIRKSHLFKSEFNVARSAMTRALREKLG